MTDLQATAERDWRDWHMPLNATSRLDDMRRLEAEDASFARLLDMLSEAHGVDLRRQMS